MSSPLQCHQPVKPDCHLKHHAIQKLPGPDHHGNLCNPLDRVDACPCGFALVRSIRQPGASGRYYQGVFSPGAVPGYLASSPSAPPPAQARRASRRTSGAQLALLLLALDCRACADLLRRSIAPRLPGLAPHRAPIDARCPRLCLKCAPGHAATNGRRLGIHAIGWESWFPFKRLSPLWFDWLSRALLPQRCPYAPAPAPHVPPRFRCKAWSGRLH